MTAALAATGGILIFLQASLGIGGAPPTVGETPPIDETTLIDGPKAMERLIEQAGSPPEWGSGLAVSPFSTVNLRNGNVLTAIPLVSWDPVGPPISFTVYHNSLSAPAGTGYEAWGFDLGDGWSVSYGSHVGGDPNDDEVTLVQADGRQDFYHRQGNDYAAPAGGHDLLAWDDAESEWVLTSPGQWRLIFDDAGRLREVHDSAGNVSTVVRDPGENYRIDYVASAADGLPEVGQNRLDLIYDGDGKLDQITDAIGREWTFEYEPGTGRLMAIHYPHDSYVPESAVQFAYQAGDSNRIEDITSRDGMTWTYDYADGRLTMVHDPVHQVGDVAIRYRQSFTWNYADPAHASATTYTDRRGYQWLVEFDAMGNIRRVTDPLSHSQSWCYDHDHNRTESTDELGHTWTTTYGPVGNVLTVSSPLTGAAAQTWTYTWLPPEPNQPGNLYRLERVSDPLGHWVEYVYADAADPTLVSAITEQPALGSDPNDATVTTLQYYSDDPNELHARGQLGLVVDANGVNHVFYYDKWGYLTRNEDGLVEQARNVFPIGPVNPGGSGSSTHNGSGQTTGSTGEDGVSGDSCPNANGNNMCCDVAWPVGPDTGYFTRLGDPPSPRVHAATVCFEDVEYDVVGRLKYLNRCYYGATARVHEIEYDDLKRPISMTSGVGEGWDYPSEYPEGIYWELERSTTIDQYDAVDRPLTITGPDGQETEYAFNGQPGYDELGRQKTVTRGELSTTFFYDDASRVERLEYGNGTKILYQYDNADRLLWIEHRDVLDLPLLRIDYVWNNDNTLDSRTEADAVAGETAVVTFSYDNRRRLIGETRVVDSATVYDILYTYDQLGNRLSKIDYGPDPDRKTLYYYDSDPANRDPNYPTNNNRLLWYEDYVDDGGWTLTRTVNYTYYKIGHVSNITIKDEYPGVGDPNDYEWHRDLAFYYTSDHKVWRVLWDCWKLDGQGQATNYEKQAAREFYYDSPRQRHMWRDVDPDTWYPDYPTHTEHWTDYLGEMPYADFEMTLTENDPNYDVQVDEQTRYLTASGVNAQQAVVDPNMPTRYFHGDLIGSAMLTTDGSGYAGSSLSYTAFGEPIGDPNGMGTRYQYAGGWGYESDLLTLDGVPGSATITIQHVGARWYQVNIGRFIQRDPAMLEGGLNLYEYALSQPAALVDPYGRSAMAGAIPLAGGAALVDGPLPFGDIVGCIILVGAGAIDVIILYKEHRSKKRKSTQDKHDAGERYRDWWKKDKKRQKPGWKPKKKRGSPGGPLLPGWRPDCDDYDIWGPDTPIDTLA